MATLIVASVGGLLTVTGCAPAAPAVTPAAVTDSWREIPGSPLSPRVGAVALWTGQEVLLIGGKNGALCPPNALCVTDGTPLADGAALDPGTGQWRRIADAPEPITRVAGAVVGQTAYIMQDELLAYDIEQDQWQRLPVPAGVGWHAIAAAGDQLVAYPTSHEVGTEDYLFDPATGAWHPLPPSPLGASLHRSMAWTGGELILLDNETPDDPEVPTVVRVAAFDPATDSWRRLPDEEVRGAGGWYAADGELVHPTLGGGDVDIPGTHWYGSRLDLITGRWSPLPDPPAGIAWDLGVRGGTTAIYDGASPNGAVFDLTTDSWLVVPAIPEAGLTGRSIVAAGTDMVVFGGVRWRTTTPTLSHRAWIWSTP